MNAIKGHFLNNFIITVDDDSLYSYSFRNSFMFIQLIMIMIYFKTDTFNCF